MRFSLIVATLGRSSEIGALLESLLAQTRDDLEVIIVDQNADDRVAPVLKPYAAHLPITHLRSTIRNANHARNLGLRQARGEIVTFPDDDCLYPPGVLTRVDAAFRAAPSLGVLTGPAASPEGGLGSGRWREESGAIDLSNVWTSVIEFNLFLPRQLMLALGGFDERLGPGTRWGSAEGNDLVCRAMAGGAVAQYDAGLRIIHPDKRLTEVAVSRAASYGRGLGFVLRRHGVPASVWFAFLVRPIGGALLSLAKLRLHNAAYYTMSVWGRLVGGLAREAREAPLPAPLQGAA
jgi:glycosyltransferase involved in cell wall biosynthesis